jgi:hypothetical protein
VAIAALSRLAARTIVGRMMVAWVAILTGREGMKPRWADIIYPEERPESFCSTTLLMPKAVILSGPSKFGYWGENLTV